jgi:hypothetical protein
MSRSKGVMSRTTSFPERGRGDPRIVPAAFFCGRGADRFGGLSIRDSKTCVLLMLQQFRRVCAE